MAINISFEGCFRSVWCSIFCSKESYYSWEKHQNLNKMNTVNSRFWCVSSNFNNFVVLYPPYKRGFKSGKTYKSLQKQSIKSDFGNSQQLATRTSFILLFFLEKLKNCDCFPTPTIFRNLFILFFFWHDWEPSHRCVISFYIFFWDIQHIESSLYLMKILNSFYNCETCDNSNVKEGFSI